MVTIQMMLCNEHKNHRRIIERSVTRIRVDFFFLSQVCHHDQLWYIRKHHSTSTVVQLQYQYTLVHPSRNCYKGVFKYYA